MAGKEKKISLTPEGESPVEGPKRRRRKVQAQPPIKRTPRAKKVETPPEAIEDPKPRSRKQFLEKELEDLLENATGRNTPLDEKGGMTSKARGADDTPDMRSLSTFLRARRTVPDDDVLSVRSVRLKKGDEEDNISVRSLPAKPKRKNAKTTPTKPVKTKVRAKKSPEPKKKAKTKEPLKAANAPLRLQNKIGATRRSNLIISKKVKNAKKAVKRLQKPEIKVEPSDENEKVKPVVAVASGRGRKRRVLVRTVPPAAVEQPTVAGGAKRGRKRKWTAAMKYESTQSPDDSSLIIVRPKSAKVPKVEGSNPTAASASTPYFIHTVANINALKTHSTAQGDWLVTPTGVVVIQAVGQTSALAVKEDPEAPSCALSPAAPAFTPLTISGSAVAPSSSLEPALGASASPPLECSPSLTAAAAPSSADSAALEADGGAVPSVTVAKNVVDLFIKKARADAELYPKNAERRASHDGSFGRAGTSGAGHRSGSCDPVVNTAVYSQRKLNGAQQDTFTNGLPAKFPKTLKEPVLTSVKEEAPRRSVHSKSVDSRDMLSESPRRRSYPTAVKPKVINITTLEDGTRRGPTLAEELRHKIRLKISAESPPASPPRATPSPGPCPDHVTPISLAASSTVWESNPPNKSSVNSPKSLSHAVTESPINEITESPTAPIIKSSSNQVTENSLNICTELPEIPVTESPKSPVTESPECTVTEPPVIPVTDSTEIPVEESPEIPVTESPESPVMESPESPIRESPESPDPEASECPVTESPESPIPDSPESPIPERPDSPKPAETSESPTESPVLPPPTAVPVSPKLSLTPVSGDPAVPVLEEVPVKEDQCAPPTPPPPCAVPTPPPAIVETAEDAAKKELILSALGLHSLKAAEEYGKMCEKKRAERQKAQLLLALPPPPPPPAPSLCSSSSSSSGTLKTVIKRLEKKGNGRMTYKASSSINDDEDMELDPSPNSKDSHESGDEESKGKVKALVIPEKASSFSIHPGRVCSDVCTYCFGKFGLLDTPCHVAQLKDGEKRRNIMLSETHLTLDSCLCDACFRHVDKKSNGTLSTERKPKRKLLVDKHARCCVENCDLEASHSVRRKLLVKLKRSLGKKICLDQNKVEKLHASNVVGLCNRHIYWYDYFMSCGICNKRLSTAHMHRVGPDVNELNQILGADAIPTVLTDKRYLCKLCHCYSNVRLKVKTVMDMNNSQKQFYETYRKRILRSHGIELPDSEPEANPTSEADKKSKGGKSRLKPAATATAATNGDTEPTLPTPASTKANNSQEYSDLRASFKMHDAPTTEAGFHKCSTTIQFTARTKDMFYELQRPYGNHSSFFRHMVMLEKMFRSGDLVLAEDATPGACGYVNSVNRRLRSYEGVTLSSRPFTITAVPSTSSHVTVPVPTPSVTVTTKRTSPHVTPPLSPPSPRPLTSPLTQLQSTVHNIGIKPDISISSVGSEPRKLTPKIQENLRALANRVSNPPTQTRAVILNRTVGGQKQSLVQVTTGGKKIHLTLSQFRRIQQMQLRKKQQFADLAKTQQTKPKTNGEEPMPVLPKALSVSVTKVSQAQP